MSVPVEASIVSSWVRAILHAFTQIPELASVNCQSLLEEAGVSCDELGATDGRVETSKMTHFWQLARETSGRPDIGLLVSSQIEVCNIHTLSFALLTSNTLRDLLEIYCQYFSVITNSASLTLESNYEGVWLVYLPRNLSVPLADEAIDCAMGGIMKSLRMATSPEFAPAQVQLRRGRPDKGGLSFEKYWQCHVQYSQQDNAILLDESLLTTPLANANPELHRLNKSYLDQQLAQLSLECVEYQIRSLLPALLSTGNCTQENVARALNMSSSSLNRKLKTEGCSYRELLEQTRQRMASHYLQASSMPVTDIAFTLGFNDVSNFTRAFRRWYDKSPRAYRQQFQ